MSSIAISLIVLACIFGGALVGTFLRAALPQEHLSAESKDVVKLGMGLVATMSALVLGLLVSSAKTSFDTQSAEVAEMSVKVMLLDRGLAHYGPEAKEARDLLRLSVDNDLNRLWPQERSRNSKVERPASADDLYDKILALSPKDDTQRAIKSQTMSILLDLGHTRWLMYAQAANAVSKPLLSVLVFWLTMIFISFGLYAPRNATVLAALFVSGLSVSGAIFLILELFTPFSGMLGISSEPLRALLVRLGQ
jgi:Protein of unknown function (DUF4239)